MRPKYQHNTGYNYWGKVRHSSLLVEEPSEVEDDKGVSPMVGLGVLGFHASEAVLEELADEAILFQQASIASLDSCLDVPFGLLN